ncbi:lipocalin-like domain-containing protein [Amaricoccus solimangrovi]|uniref:Iron ABC transporter permease n=1 Tax=Amaricoccus solimangrovi TaxID=2589815 RepID=A0A501WYE1_9RHOB|nr:lipocalin-like domain-containing protein [Amaricoccus solimangrovi]TPE53610.1 iron ABC transporter permease [Amaricoccus solimangrovi]
MLIRTILLLLLPAAAGAQGFAGLGTEAEDYLPVTAPARLVFPRDHGPHPGFRIEWWYLTANLTGPDGEEYGAQWTLFRQPLSPGPERGGWDSPTVWMAHAAVTSAETHLFAETFARGGIGQAGVTAEPFRAFIDDWSMTGAGRPGADALADLAIHAAGDGFSYDLAARAAPPPVPQGADGFSVKSASGQASYYYSQPFYGVTGTLRLGPDTIPVTGTAWLDREWSSQPLASGQRGWDWFALSLASGARVMLFALRSEEAPAFLSGTWIAPDGAPTPLSPGEIRLTPLTETRVADRRLPTRWRIEVPRFGLDTTAEALNPAAWMGTLYSYWEGPIRLDGGATGRGYLEMTGYR